MPGRGGRRWRNGYQFNGCIQFTAIRGQPPRTASQAGLQIGWAGRAVALSRRGRAPRLGRPRGNIAQGVADGHAEFAECFSGVLRTFSDPTWGAISPGCCAGFSGQQNAACRQHGVAYSRFIAGLNKAGIELDRKALSEMAIHDEAAFKALVEKSQSALAEA